MSQERRILFIGVGVLLVGLTVREHVDRQLAQRRYREAVDARHRLEQQVSEVLSTHTRLTATLHREQQRSQALTEALASTRTQLEQAVGQLTEENKSVRTLQERLSRLQQQMDQLQGELAMTLEQRQRVTAAEPKPVQLERIVVTDPGASALRGRVLSVHQDWNFVVIDLGWNSVRIGDTVSIFRNDQLLAKAKVERVQEQVCVATVLPDWDANKIQINDLARIL